MYKSSYSQAKFGLEARRKIQKPRGKSCGYYMRVVFFFSSLIQSLIIVSLVLFLVYGSSPDAAAESRVKDLEKSFNHLSIDNINLRQQGKNLNATLTDKMRNDKYMMSLRQVANGSGMFIANLKGLVTQCENDKGRCQIQLRMSQCFRAMPPNENQVQQLEQLLKLVSSNFSQTVQFMRMEMENTAMDRDTLTLEAISLRRDKTFLQRQLEGYRKKCKEDFVQSLAGISDVSKAFLLKIDNLLPNVSPFLLTCEKQLHHLDQIRNNCTGLSREVENKFQQYLNKVGSQMSEIEGCSAKLQADKDQLKVVYNWCSYNRSAMALEHREKLQKTQEKYDRETERLLMDSRRLQGNKELQETVMKVKEGEIVILKDKMNNLNTSLVNCGSRTGMGNPGMSGPNQSGPWSSRHGMGDPGSTGNGFGRAVASSRGFESTGMGSNPFGSAGAGGTGTGNKPGSTNQFGNTGMGRTGSSSSSTALGSLGPGKVWAGRTGTGAAGELGAMGNAGMGEARSSATGQGNRGPTKMGLEATGGWGSTGMGNTGMGGEGSSVTGQGKRGSTAGTELGAGTGGWGASATGNGNTGLGRSGSSASSSSGATRMNGSGMDGSKGLAHINQHLRELQQYSTADSGSEVSG
ncbi:keratin, type I cytoskeletal 9 [Oncorhynchus kisutch]|uniref:Plasmalemma vesicle associated protein a n=1 Tax=Oncorhynchus kisutch TaxID=8019 RepID=A0A8C7GI07_ONCKI|nr:keratin, type I cytoskeletal 9 [Oncorhynchus kisutch]